MKHPLQLEKLNNSEFETIFNQQTSRYLGYSLSALALCAVFGYVLLVPLWGVVPLLVVACAGFSLCCSVSLLCGHYSALQEMRAPDKAGPDYRAPSYFS